MNTYKVRGLNVCGISRSIGNITYGNKEASNLCFAYLNGNRLVTYGSGEICLMNECKSLEINELCHRKINCCNISNNTYTSVKLEGVFIIRNTHS